MIKKYIRSTSVYDNIYIILLVKINFITAPPKKLIKKIYFYIFLSLFQFYQLVLDQTGLQKLRKCDSSEL